MVKSKYCSGLNQSLVQALCGPIGVQIATKVPIIIEAVEKESTVRMQQTERQTGGSTPARSAQWPSQASTQGTVHHGRSVN